MKKTISNVLELPKHIQYAINELYNPDNLTVTLNNTTTVLRAMGWKVEPDANFEPCEFTLVDENANWLSAIHFLMNDESERLVLIYDLIRGHSLGLTDYQESFDSLYEVVDSIEHNLIEDMTFELVQRKIKCYFESTNTKTLEKAEHMAMVCGVRITALFACVGNMALWINERIG